MKNNVSELSLFKLNFWDAWGQKVFRNLASIKMWWMALLYAPTIWGMFHMPPGSKEPWISATAGLTFLGGGFVTLATSRIIARTGLTEDADGIDCDK